MRKHSICLCLAGPGNERLCTTQENDLTTADVDAASTSTHVTSRITAGSSTSQNLYTYINHSRCFGLNLQDTDNLVKVLRPHHERNDRNDCVCNVSDVFCIHIFTGMLNLTPCPRIHSSRPKMHSSSLSSFPK